MLTKYRIIIFALLFFSCNQNKYQQKFVDGNHVLYLNTYNYGKKITWDKPFVVILKLENINLSKNELYIIGPNAHARHVSENEMEITMHKNKENANEDNLKSESINFVVGFINDQKKKVEHKFILKLDE